MEKLISYICGDMNMLKHDMSLVIKNLRAQNRFNKGVVLLTIAGGFYIYTNEILREQNYKTIKKLTKEVEELKKSKGE